MIENLESDEVFVNGDSRVREGMTVSGDALSTYGHISAGDAQNCDSGVAEFNEMTDSFFRFEGVID